MGLHDIMHVRSGTMHEVDGNALPSGQAGPASLAGEQAPSSLAGEQAPSSLIGERAPAPLVGERAPAPLAEVQGQEGQQLGQLLVPQALQARLSLQAERAAPQVLSHHALP